MVVNGVGVNGESGENFFATDESGSDVRVAELKKKIEALEREKEDLANENEETKEQIKKMTLEIDDLKKDEAKMKKKMGEREKEIEQALESKKAVDVIAARACELETELYRLQHDSIAEMSAAEEARAEAEELRKLLGDKESRVEYLEKELGGLNQAKAESEQKVRDLEKKIGVLEKKEVEERSKRIRVEEELREKLEEKEREIQVSRLKIEELERVAAGNGSQLENWVKEKNDLEEALKESKDKARSMESNIVLLRQEASEAQNMIRTLNEKVTRAVNGAVKGIDAEVKGLKLQWPVVAAGSTGAIAAAAAVAYIFYGKRR